MSNYQKLTTNPITMRRSKASWVDDYFGRHRYGIIFKESDTVFCESDITKAEEFYKMYKTATLYNYIYKPESNERKRHPVNVRKVAKVQLGKAKRSVRAKNK